MTSDYCLPLRAVHVGLALCRDGAGLFGEVILSIVVWLVHTSGVLFALQALKHQSGPGSVTAIAG